MRTYARPIIVSKLIGWSLLRLSIIWQRDSEIDWKLSHVQMKALTVQCCWKEKSAGVRRVYTYTSTHHNIISNCPNHPHFYRAMLCIPGTSHGPVSVSVSVCVCPSVTSRCSTKTAKRRITQTTPHDTPGTSFLMPKISAKFDRGHTLRGRRM